MSKIDGIVVNGQTIDTIVMPNGDEISIGGTTVDVIPYISEGQPIGNIVVDGTNNYLYTPIYSDENVKQTAVDSSQNGDYAILWSGSQYTGTIITEAYKTSSFYYSPSFNRVTVGNIQVGNVSQPGTISLGQISFTAPSSTSTNTIYLPNASGTLALTTDIPAPYDSSTNPNGYITMSNLPIYDGTVEINARGQSF